MNCGSRNPVLGAIDKEHGEFWVENPFQLAQLGENLSAYEKNRLFLNTGEMEFVDASFCSGADLDSDSRSAVVSDFDLDGKPDLLVGSAGGGALRLFRNTFPDENNWIRLRLQGTTSNRYAIGSRVVLQVGERKIVRDLFPVNGFQGQGPCELLIGIGKSDFIDQLTIRWPTGAMQSYQKLPSDQTYRIIEEKKLW